jgi:hypothetical protein
MSIQYEYHKCVYISPNNVVSVRTCEVEATVTPSSKYKLNGACCDRGLRKICNGLGTVCKMSVNVNCL